MVKQPRRGARTIVDALRARRDVVALTLFGSYAREGDDTAADGGSDFDLHVICSHPAKLLQSAWAEEVLGELGLEVWSSRPALGGVTKISILLAEEELDLVVVPARRMRWARRVVALGLHRRSEWARNQLAPLVLIMQPGYRVLKGGARWEDFWQRVVHEVPEPRLTNEEVRRMGAVAQVNLRSLQHKLDRGELRAAQRWLHEEMAATNFRLMHELRRRRGERSFFDARRVEKILHPDELALVTVNAGLSAPAIGTAAERAAEATARLVEMVQTEPLSPNRLG